MVFNFRCWSDIINIICNVFQIIPRNLMFNTVLHSCNVVQKRYSLAVVALRLHEQSVQLCRLRKSRELEPVIADMIKRIAVFIKHVDKT